MAFRTVSIILALTSAVCAGNSNLRVRDSNDCPDNWSSGTLGDEVYCCFGSLTLEQNNGKKSGSCCVTDPSKGSDGDERCPKGQEINITESNYESLVSAASKSVMGEASATDDDKSGSPATNTAESTGSAASATDNSATDTGNAGPIVTSNPMAKIGGAVAAAVLIAL